MNISEWVDYVTKPSRILIVSNDAGISGIIQSALKKFECACNVAITGQEAISLIQSAHFDLVFLDLQLPGKSGLATLQVLKEVAPRTPVVIMTDSSNSELIEEAAALGVVSLMRKAQDFSAASIEQIFQIFKIRGVPSEMVQCVRPEAAGALTNA